MTSQLAKIVAANVRAQAAMRGQTQTQVAQLVELAQPAVSDRYRERRQWQLEDLEKLADAWGVDPAELLARPKGFEPLTFWLGADHTMTVLTSEELGGLFWWWCDVAGCSVGGWDTVVYLAAEGAAAAALEHGRTVHTMGVEGAA